MQMDDNWIIRWLFIICVERVPEVPIVFSSWPDVFSAAAAEGCIPLKQAIQDESNS